MRSRWCRTWAIGLVLCFAGQGCATDLTTTLSDAPNEASYDGSLKAFVDFVEAHGKEWPLPSNLQMFEGANGAMLRYAFWPAPNPAERAGVVVFFQGRTEFIEKNIYTYRDLIDRNYEVWTLDWRGQGLSERLLTDEPERGHIDSYDTYLADAEIFLNEIVKLDSIDSPQKILLAHSMGGAIGTLYLMEHDDAFDKAVFSSPMIRLPGGVDNWAVRFGNWAKKSLNPAICAGPLGDITDDCSWTSEFKDGVDVCAIADQAPEEGLINPKKTERYSHDFKKIAEVECLIANNRPSVPSLGLGGTTSGWLRQSYKATDQINKAKADLKTPLLIIGGSQDKIVSNAGQDDFCDVDNPACCRLEIEGAGHELLIESEPFRAEFFDAFRSFVSGDALPEAFCAARR